MGGSGSVLNMIVSMRQNRANKASNKQNFRSNDKRGIHSGNHAEALHFKEVPKEELEKIKSSIRQKSRLEQKKQIVLFILTAALVIALMLFVFI